MVSVAELRRPEFSLHWHEAVAIVAEVAAMVMSRGLPGVPAPESIILVADGSLRFLDDGLPDEAPVRWLGDMLGVVLSSVTCPPELRQLVADTVADPPAYATVDAFASALAFYERPARPELLRALAARTQEVALQARANEELEHLQTRTRNQPAKAAAAAAHPKRWRISRPMLLGIGAVVWIGMLAGGFFALVAAPTRIAMTERVRARVDSLAGQALEAVGLSVRKGPPPAPVENAAPRATVKPAKRKPLALPLTISLRELSCECLPPLPALPAPGYGDAATTRDRRIYTPEEVDVEPAVLVRPHLPSEPPASVPPEEIGVLEIVVSPSGAVEHVQLIAPANRFHERMIVAAAKAWLFEPATMFGRPVRYRTRIRVTL